MLVSKNSKSNGNNKSVMTQKAFEKGSGCLQTLENKEQVGSKQTAGGIIVGYTVASCHKIFNSVLLSFNGLLQHRSHVTNHIFYLAVGNGDLRDL